MVISPRYKVLDRVNYSRQVTRERVQNHKRSMSNKAVEIVSQRPTDIQVLKSELNSGDPAELDNVKHSTESSQLTHGERRKRTPPVDIQIMSKTQMRQDQIDLTSLRRSKIKMQQPPEILGFPQPQKYDKYYITKYSLPKGLNAVKAETHEKLNQTVHPKKREEFGLKRNKKDGTFYLKSRKRKNNEGFRGFKLKSWNRSDYRNMMNKTQIQSNNVNNLYRSGTRHKTTREKTAENVGCIIVDFKCCF
jgi:hypothetical protein